MTAWKFKKSRPKNFNELVNISLEPEFVSESLGYPKSSAKSFDTDFSSEPFVIPSRLL